MPLTAAAASVIGAGLSAAGTGASLFANAKLNRKTMRWNERMYEQQRRDALADWEMQNAYNSPAAQMQRLREAGLNPHLVYGNGADAQGGIVRSTDVKSWNPQAPDFSQVGSIAGQYFDIQARAQTVNNLKAQNTILEEQAKKLEAETRAIELGILDRRFDLDFKTEMRPTNVSLKYSSLDYLRARENRENWETDKTIQYMNQRKEMFPYDVKKQAQAIENMVEQNVLMKMDRSKKLTETAEIWQRWQNLKESGKILKWQAQLSEMGLTPNDPVYLRAVDQAVRQIAKELGLKQ